MEQKPFNYKLCAEELKWFSWRNAASEFNERKGMYLIDNGVALLALFNWLFCNVLLHVANAIQCIRANANHLLPWMACKHTGESKVKLNTYDRTGEYNGQKQLSKSRNEYNILISLDMDIAIDTFVNHNALCGTRKKHWHRVWADARVLWTRNDLG